VGLIYNLSNPAVDLDAAAAEAFFLLEHKKLNFGSPEHFSRPCPKGNPPILKSKKSRKSI